MKNKKGFTLIELLAVIVILGLLMAIAIPSVTKYITESRKKTLTTTLSNYIGALVNEVNDLSYTFTGQNTIYAVPIECIALERGGTNPFGHWYQANDAYFAYVLVQYDDTNSKYVYGFTFKDSAGYGLYPTIQPNIKEKGSQIKTGYTLNKPVTGDLTSLTTLAKWQESGFKVDSTTNLHVLEATSEDAIGDGINTCTLQQKGDNYAQVEEDKKISKEEKEEKYLKETTAYAIYSDDDKSLTFVRSKEEIKNGDVYDGINVTAVYKGFETNTYSWGWAPWHNYELDITRIIFKDIISPISTAYWFADLYNCTYIDVTRLNTSKLTDMKYMFRGAGYYANSFKIVGLDNMDTSKVTNMSSLFYNAGEAAIEFDIGNLSNWNTSKVTDMQGMFNSAGRNATTFYIGDLSNWDTSNVAKMSSMFSSAGSKAKEFDIGNLDNWDVSNITDMYSMFSAAGSSATKWNIGDLSNWDTSNVTDMRMVFSSAGASANTFNIGNLGNWDTSNVTNMTWMFQSAGKNATTFYIGDLSKWNTSNVTDMDVMFSGAGYTATWSLDCSDWNVDKVTHHDSFNWNVWSKVIPPIWVN